jgi:alkylation response protein AidB-like acyl-CoA dehydrogenase
MNKGNKGITAFVVDMKAPGVSCGKPEDKMGIIGCATSDIILENVAVPESDRLGEEGEGFKIAMKTLNTGRLGVAAQAIGIAQGCLDAAVEYAKERKQFGKRIGDFQAIGFMIAEMATKLEAAKQLTYKAAYLMDTRQDATLNASMAKYYASEVCNEIAAKAVQIHGGYGFIKDYKVERMYRDCRVFTIYEGSSQVQEIVISRKLLKK